MNGRSLENPLIAPLRASCLILGLAVAACLSLLISPLVVIALIGVGAMLWAVFRFPVLVLGIVLAFLPVEFMAIAMGKFVGLPHMTMISIFDKELLLILAGVALCVRNGFRPAMPDFWLLVFTALAVISTIISGNFLYLAADLGLLIPYMVGRVTELTRKQQELWATCAVWIVAVISVLGMIEVFFLGEGPRTMLYVATDSEVEGGRLVDSFFAAGFSGMREAATMVGPNGFAALCMIALVLWWVYCRNLVPAIMIAGGLLCSLTRSAWAGTIVSIGLLAPLMKQEKRFLRYAAVACALFVAAIPILGLKDFILVNRTRQDPSAQYHQSEILSGVNYALDHPLGSGNGQLSPLASTVGNSALGFETTYPELAAEYGIPAALCFIGFLLSALYFIWGKASLLSYAAVGIMVGLGIFMIFTNPLIDRRLIPWAFFPVGLAVRAVQFPDIPHQSDPC